MERPKPPLEMPTTNPSRADSEAVPVAATPTRPEDPAEASSPRQESTAEADELPSSSTDAQPVPITFDDLKLELEPDSVFEPSMLTERVRELDGRRIRIRGFIFPSVFQQTGITSFPLIKNLECKFGPGGQAHHIILVEMVPDQSTSFTVRPIAVEGILSVRPWSGPDGNTWALYHLVGEKVL